MKIDLLLLADSRLPAGGHAHSGGLEPAAAAGLVTCPADLADFLRGRLATSGLTAAALAAAACAHAHAAGAGDPADAGDLADAGDPADAGHGWRRLDAEADARTPSPAQRQASRAQGRALLRAARTTWPHPVLDALATIHARRPRHTSARSHARAGDRPATAGAPGEPPHDHLGETPTRRDHADVLVRPGEHGPHHPVALGAAAAAAGGTPEQAAAIAAYGAVSGPASAAVRLLGLDPLAVHRVLADLAPEVDAAAVAAAEAASHADGDWAALPASSAPALDLFAERHLQSEMRLFES